MFSLDELLFFFFFQWNAFIYNRAFKNLEIFKNLYRRNQYDNNDVFESNFSSVLKKERHWPTDIHSRAPEFATPKEKSGIKKNAPGLYCDRKIWEALIYNANQLF